MFGTGVIVFREVLEAALLIGIVAAATRAVPGRNRWLTAGLLAGLAGAGLVAVSTGAIASWASGIGQELFNALVLAIAVSMLGWHNIWMSSHGAALAADVRLVGNAIRDGRRECSILFVVVGLAVLREGSETVLFLYGVAADGSARPQMLVGGIIGLAAGIAAGYAIYAGLLQIRMSRLFAATGILVLLLAAGMASQAARYLIQADLLPSLTTPVWDTSNLIPADSALGVLLHGLIGYDPHPAGMQLIFYIAALTIIAAGMKWAQRPHPQHSLREAR